MTQLDIGDGGSPTEPAEYGHTGFETGAGTGPRRPAALSRYEA